MGFVSFDPASADTLHATVELVNDQVDDCDWFGFSVVPPEDACTMPWLKIPDRRRTIRKLGIEVAESTVAKNMVRKRGPASPTWTAFLRTHLREMTSVDFFVVPTVGNQFLVLSNEQRRVLQFNVTTNPTAEWTGQALAEPRTWSN